MKIIFLLIIIFMAIAAHAGQRVRRVEVNGDQIVTVKTSIGIATIIQVPDRPNSVVVGDQDSFKVEYLDQAITIKPILLGAKSNLYVYTDWKRYNVELISGAESIADYVVYLESPKPLKKTKNFIKWTSFRNSMKNNNLFLEIKRLGKTGDGILLIEFTIKSSLKEIFKPEWLWLSQDDVTRPIQNLFLSNLEVNPSNLITGTLQLKLEDILSNVPMRLELRRNKNSFLTLTKVDSWN